MPATLYEIIGVLRYQWVYLSFELNEFAETNFFFSYFFKARALKTRF